MHRFYSDEPLKEPGQRVTLSPEESHHAAKVLRLNTGEEVQLLDGLNLWSGTLEEVSDKKTIARIASLCESPESPVHVTLLQGLPKAEKMEWILQKATELGVWKILPVETERSIPKASRLQDKQERWQKIALEAAKQSGRAHVPEIAAPASWSKLKPTLQKEHYDQILTAWEEEHTLSMTEAVQACTRQHGRPESVLIVIGPEGGLTAEECGFFQEMGGMNITLGRRILRTETAGLCALSVLWSALGEM